MNNKEPQTHAILRHMKEKGSISPIEALACHGIFRLAARINDLRNDGFAIHTKICRDVNGSPYARYSFSKSGGKGK